MGHFEGIYMAKELLENCIFLNHYCEVRMNVKRTSHFCSQGHLIFYLCFSLFILSLWFPSHLPAQKQEPIVETVYVENVDITVRVFEGKQAVQGLKKDDFELYINGKRKVVNGFFEVRKTLEQNPAPDSLSRAPDAAGQPRLFVLIFNLSDFQQDLTNHLDMLFDRVIKPGDFLMVITNRYFFPEWKVEAPGKTKAKISDILAREVEQLKREMLRFENDLHAISSQLKSRLADPFERRSDDQWPSNIFRDFFFTYQFILEDIRNQYLDLPVGQYIKISEYLRGQQVEKWVLNFYQMGRLPLLDKSGHIHRMLDQLMDPENAASGGSGTGATASASGLGNYPLNAAAIREKLQSLYFDFILKIQQIDELFVKDIGSAFLNSGATVHTLLLKPIRQTSITGYGDYKYETVATNSESILKQLSKLTGGSIVKSNRIMDFIADITQREDIIYRLTYAPDSRRKKPAKVEIKINNPKYRLVYDNQKRLKPFRDIMKRLKQGSQDLEIESIACNGDMVTAKLNNIELVQFEGESFGAVRARIKILDKGKNLIADFEKTYKGIKEKGLFQAKLPPITKGRYNLVLEVKDLFALKNVYTGDAVSFSKK